ncbi:MAG: hypothetical protein V3V22_06540 [Methylococcales bacterium]
MIHARLHTNTRRTRSSVNAPAKNYSSLGRGLLVVTLGIAVYNIAVAEDKVVATARESVVLGGGFSGGALAGLTCSPGVPVCVTLGVFLGGVLGALGADASFGWFF